MLVLCYILYIASTTLGYRCIVLKYKSNIFISLLQQKRSDSNTIQMSSFVNLYKLVHPNETIQVLLRQLVLR